MSAAVIHSTPGRASTLIKPAAGMLAVVAIGAAATVVLANDGLRRELELAVQSPIGLIGLFVASALSSATLILPVPGMALTVLAAAVANPLLVGLLAGLGQAVGELTGYLAGSSGGALLGDRLQVSRMAGWMRRRGALTIFVLALVPNPAFDVAGILAGAMRMPLLHYLLAAASGKVIRNTLLAWTVAQSGTLLVGGGLG